MSDLNFFPFFYPNISFDQKMFYPSISKFFIFQISGRWFPWHPKGGCTPTSHKPRDIFSERDILSTASRLNILYGLETWYVQSSRHVRITQKVLRHIQHFWRIYDIINVGSFCHFAVFGYSKCHEVCRNSWLSHLQSLMCKRHCVLEL